MVIFRYGSGLSRSTLEVVKRGHVAGYDSENSCTLQSKVERNVSLTSKMVGTK